MPTFSRALPQNYNGTDVDSIKESRATEAGHGNGIRFSASAMNELPDPTASEEAQQRAFQEKVRRELESFKACLKEFVEQKDTIVNRLLTHQGRLEEIFLAEQRTSVKPQASCAVGPQASSCLVPDSKFDWPTDGEDDEVVSIPSSGLDQNITNSTRIIMRKSTNTRVQGSKIEPRLKALFQKLNQGGNAKMPREFEFLSASFIICNTILLGYSLQYHSAVGRSLSWSFGVDMTFSILFLLDLLLRACWLKKWFVIGESWAWNMFDSVLVVSMVLEEIIRIVLGHEDDMSHLLNSLRMFRVVRALKTIKIFHYINFTRHARVLLLSIHASLVSFSSVVMLIVTIIYLLAVVMTNGALGQCIESESSSRAACSHFGTLWRSCSSLFQVFLGGILWGTLLDDLDEFDWPYVVIFLIAITFFAFLFAHVFIGVFVRIVNDVADGEKDHRFVKDHQEESRKFAARMKKVFGIIDLNNDNVLRLHELENAFKNENVSALFASMDLDATAVETIFSLLDTDCSDFVDFDEFAFGCLRLQGKARAVDLERTRNDLVRMEATLDDIKLHLCPGSATSSQKIRHLQTSIQDHLHSDRYTMTRTYTMASRKPTISRNRIDEPEMRAMTLSELQYVVSLIKKRCGVEGWMDPMTRERLEIAKVNLYHFTFHYIAPRTCSDEITLLGLKCQNYKRGDILTQTQADNRTVVGQATVLEDVYGSDVFVKLLKGRIVSEDESPDYKMHKEAEPHKEECGLPSEVLQDTGISFKELISSSWTKPQWYVCHWWGEPINDFVKCCEEHASRRDAETYWVCAYALRQHDLATDIGDDPMKSSFKKAMGLAHGVLLILDPTAVPFQRVWCCFEVFETVTSDKMLDIVTVKDEARLLTQMPIPGELPVDKFFREKDFPLSVLNKGIQARLEMGQSTVDQDRIAILQNMGRVATGVFDAQIQRVNIDLANRRLQGNIAVAAWPQAVRRGCVLNFVSKASEPVSLPAVLQRDSQRRSLDMVFAGMKEVTDVEVNSIAEGLPSKLEALSLSFEGCFNITDDGVKSLADKIHTLPLTQLSIDFGSCKRLTDDSVSYLARRLPPKLLHANLHFALIPNISKSAVKSLAAHLPGSVTKLDSSFIGTQVDHHFNTVGKLKRHRQSR